MNKQNQVYQISDNYFGNDYTFFFQVLAPCAAGVLSAMISIALSGSVGVAFGLIVAFGISGFAWGFKNWHTWRINKRLKRCPRPHREISNFFAWDEGDEIKFGCEVSGSKFWYFQGVSGSGALVLSTHSDLEYSESAIMISANAGGCLGMKNRDIKDSEITPEQAEKAVENSDYMEFLETADKEYRRLQSMDSPARVK